jgi:signal transduction histidine kinase
VLEETVRQAQQLAADRKINLETTPGIYILGDRDAFKQIMVILLDNALKHSEGEIEVKSARISSQIEVCVQDDGPGISPDKMEHIYDRFYRGEDDPISQGFGLGLPIAKSLVEGMKGNIFVESEPGKGSKVTIKLLDSDAIN